MLNVFVITRKQDVTANVFIWLPIINLVGTYFSSSNQGLKSHWPGDSCHFTQLYPTEGVWNRWNQLESGNQIIN